MKPINTLINWIDFAARTALGMLAMGLFCCVVGTAIAWAMVMGRPSPLGKEEDSE